MSRDIRMTLWRLNERLVVVDLAPTGHVADMELDVCLTRIGRGDATHVEIESMSGRAIEKVQALRSRAGVHAK